MWLLGIFIVVPIIEIALFIQVGGAIGLWPTLLAVVLTAITGTLLVRSQGAHAWRELQRSLAEMRDPSRPLAHGVMILAAGILLLTPGFFTDAISLLLLIPTVRNAVIKGVARNIRERGINAKSWPDQQQASSRADDVTGHRRRPPYEDGSIIDGEYIAEDNETPNHHFPPDVEPENNTSDKKSGWTRH